MSIRKITNIFSDHDLSDLNNIINNKYVPTLEDGQYVPFDLSISAGIDKNLGRLQFDISEYFQNPHTSLNETINDIARESFYENCGLPWSLGSVLYVEYNKKYGTPTLPPHFDGEISDIIINYQLDSNTSWDLGIGLDIYRFENNSAILFNPNEHIHWRPHKEFEDDKYVKMIFFRFNTIPHRDYSYQTYSQDHEVFKEVSNFRNGLAH
jgi:hypothetical protein